MRRSFDILVVNEDNKRFPWMESLSADIIISRKGDKLLVIKNRFGPANFILKSTTDMLDYLKEMYAKTANTYVY